MTPPHPPAPDQDATGWWVPGTLVLRLVLVAVLAVALSGALAAWLVTRASGQEAMRRMVAQQTDEVEVVARLLASKIEQSQKVLRTVAAGITPGMLESPSSLEWLLQQGLPAVQFFDTMQVARDNGELRINLRAGRLEKAADVDPAERDALRRTMVDGKPLVSELVAGRTSEARVMFTMPLHRDDGTVLGVVAGALRLQSQGLLPPSMTLPAREDSRLIVFTRDGTILSHSNPARIMGQVRDEPGLAPVYAAWQSQSHPVVGRGATHVQPDHVVSMAGMPLPQWIVARVSHSQALLEPLQGAQREAWWLAAAAMALCMLLAAVVMVWMAQPLAHLTYSARRMMKRAAGARGSHDARQHSVRQQVHHQQHQQQTGQIQPQSQPQRQQQQQQQQPQLHVQASGPSPSTAPLPAAAPHDDDGGAAWPRTGGEVGQLVRAFEGLVQQGREQHWHMETMHQQFQAVLDNASVGIIISRNEMLDVVGRQASVMLGYGTRELQGHPVRVLYASDADYARLGARVQAQFAAHGAFDGDVCFMRKDGSPVWARVQGRGVHPGETNNGTVWILEDITAAREAQVQQAWEQTHDALTQLFNRPAFDERLGQLLAERSARPREPALPGQEPSGDGVVLFMDLDHFTVVNDIAGHDAGDDVLRHVARLLESQVRQIGWAARLSGDEFAVVLPGCALARGQAVAEQLRASVQAWEPSYQGRSFTLGVSVGLVVLDASLQDVPSVLYAADMACYDAKRAGRNRVETRHAKEASASGRMALGPV